MRLAALRLVPLPGDGLVGRWPGLVLVASGGDAPRRADLVGLMAAAAADGADAATVAHRLAGYITAGEPAGLPSFAALADADVGIAVVLRGPVTLEAHAGSDVTRLAGTDRPTWVDDYLRGEYYQVVVDASGGEPGAGSDLWDLQAGVVPGSGARLSPSGAGPAVGVEAAAAEPVADSVADPEETDELPDPPGTGAADTGEVPAAEEPRTFVSVDFEDVGDVVPRAPLPVAEDPTEELVPVGTAPRPDDAPAAALVQGLRCIKGHFNHPQARYCALCGISMVQQTHVLVEGERPPLGILVFGDGMTVGLDASYLIGRDPAIDPAVDAGDLRALQLDDPDQILSRVHCEIRLHEWDVHLVDRNSANGTFVRNEGAEEWNRLAPDRPEPLGPGMEAKVGSHRFVFESHHRQA